MKTVEDIRHANLLALLQGFKTIQAFADQIEKSHAQVSQWKNRSKRHKTDRVSNVDSDSARHIEHKCGKPLGWMDQDHQRTPERYIPLIRKFERIQDAEKRDRVLASVLALVQEAVAASPSPEPIQELTEDPQTDVAPTHAAP